MTDFVVESFIGGQSLAGRGDEFALINPATEQTLTVYREAGESLAHDAHEAAQKGGAAWRKMTASARGAILFDISRLVRRDAEALAQAESRIAGKPIRDCRGEVMKVADMFAYYAGWADKIEGRTVPVPTSHLNLIEREPLGTIVQMTPWNAPIFTAGWQIAPALAAGNAVILKPSEWTPLTSLMLAKLAQEAGLPDGALNVVTGGPITGAALVNTALCGKAVFIGSVPTGRKVAALAANAGRPALLELGGKSANIIFADCDLARAVKAAQGAIFAAAGQSCTAGSRLLVERSVYDSVVAALIAATRLLRVGCPQDETTEIGPLHSARQLDRIGGMIVRAQSAGLDLLAGGRRPDGLSVGYYLSPTILSGAKPGTEIFDDEIFGPVLAVTPFDTEEEALALANAGEFDLAGAVWSGDGTRAIRVARALRAGSVWINGYRTLSVQSPFGGMRGSGFGRSSGHDVLLEYTQPKSIWIETDHNAPIAFGYDVLKQ
jgi:aldehyde dehydrogenase (NAD+)